MRPLHATLALLAAVVAGGTVLHALHPNNAGPQDFEIKFKLPPPPALKPDEALKTFKLPPGFRIEIVAAEPLVEDPIAMSFDERGRLYVVEMRGYMHDIKGLGEDQPIGRVKLLEDLDGDGRMDKATVFVDNLLMPRAVMAVGGGALVAESPNLIFFRDTNGDGVADEKEVVATNYGTKGGQPEHMANGPMWALDNWIYSSNYGTRFRYQNGKWISAPTTGRGQWGLTQDDFGRLYYNYNSDLLRGDMVPSHYFSRNPNSTSKSGLSQKVLNDQTVWPSHPTPGVNRGYSAGTLRDDGTLKTATATCGPVIYRGDLFPGGFQGNAFIPEPAGNLVKRVVLSETDGVVTAKNAHEAFDFLTSTDERFRPVNAYNGPDGALYIVDLYRGILQHKAFLTHYLIANIKDRQLETPIGLGRIYRVVPEGKQARPVKLPGATADLVNQLGHPNGWVRETAQRVLVERGGEAAIAPLRKMAVSGAAPFGRLHALWTLEGLGAIEPSVIAAGLKDKDSKIRAAVIRVAEPLLVPATREEVLPDLLKLAGDASPDVQIQLAFTLGALPVPEAEEVVDGILPTRAANPLIRDAALTGLRGRELETLERLLASPAWKTGAPGQKEFLSALAQCVMNERRAGRIQHLLQISAALPAGSAQQLALLEGMAGKPASGKGAPPVKLVYLDAQPPELAILSKGAGKNQALVTSLEQRLAWPGKPGVPPPPVIVPLTAPQQALFDKGRDLYSAICAGCHQPNGVGQEGLAPPLVDSEWVLGPVERLPRIVLHGLSGPVTVAGVLWNMEMPGIPDLPDDDVAAVLTYIRREWEHNAAPVAPEAVRKVREETKGRSQSWTEKELLDIGGGKARQVKR